MTLQAQPMTAQERRAVVGVCILAAFADGAQDEVERAEIQRIVDGFKDETVEVSSVYQDILGGRLSLADVAQQLQSPAAKALAYEMAVCVCLADGGSSDAERQFLVGLREALQLDPPEANAHHQTAEALVTQPFTGPVPPVVDSAREAELDRSILNTSILTGALEIMPQTLGTLAIIPIQMRMVYTIGKRYGFDLDSGHIKDFLATLGVGLTSQVVEGYAQRLIGGLTRRVAGRLVGAFVGQAVSSAFAFATTYALGQVARQYYSSGRTLTAAQLKDVFSSMLQQGHSLQDRYSSEIAQKARQVNVGELMHLVRN
jgi:uncharacterized protein (DUF697 family)/tellurite resistance protein